MNARNNCLTYTGQHNAYDIGAAYDGNVGCHTILIQRLSCIVIGCSFLGHGINNITQLPTVTLFLARTTAVLNIERTNVA